MNRFTRRKGMMLLQTLIMAVLLSMISVMVMQWVLGRYMIAARTQRSNASKTHTTGYADCHLSAWNFNWGTIPSACDRCLNRFKVLNGSTFGTAVASSGNKYTFTNDEDTPDLSCP